MGSTDPERDLQTDAKIVPLTGGGAGFAIVRVELPTKYSCAGCGAKFEAPADAERCPACGLPLVLAQMSAASVDATGLVTRDTTCRKCGYNLRGLQRDGRCPECAAPVAMSVHGDLLCYSEPAYVTKLASGAGWAVGGFVLTLFALMLSIVAMVQGVWSASVSGISQIALYGLLIGGGVGLLSGGSMFLVGVWLLTTAEPGAFDAARRDRDRRLVRVYLVVSLLGQAMSYMFEKLAPPVPVMAVVVLAMLGFSVLGVVACRAYFTHLGTLARRLPDANLLKNATTLAKNLTIALGVLVGFRAIDTIVHWGPAIFSPLTASSIPVAFPPGANSTFPYTGSPFGTAIGCISSLAWLAVLVYLVRAVRLHFALRKPLEQQAKLATKLWSRAAARASTPTLPSP